MGRVGRERQGAPAGTGRRRDGSPGSQDLQVADGWKGEEGIRMSDRSKAGAALAQSHFSILVVEDDPGLREDLRSALSSQGCWVDTAATSPEALRYVLVRNYHVVVSSFSLPLVDGLELTRLLSRRIQSPRIVLICGNDDPTWVKEAFDAGASRVLPKPLAAPALAELVEKLGSPD